MSRIRKVVAVLAAGAALTLSGMPADAGIVTSSLLEATPNPATPEDVITVRNVDDGNSTCVASFEFLESAPAGKFQPNLADVEWLLQDSNGVTVDVGVVQPDLEGFWEVEVGPLPVGEYLFHADCVGGLRPIREAPFSYESITLTVAQVTPTTAAPPTTGAAPTTTTTATAAPARAHTASPRFTG